MDVGAAEGIGNLAYSLQSPNDCIDSLALGDGALLHAGAGGRVDKVLHVDNLWLRGTLDNRCRATEY